jgi:hypothetical protein
MFNKAMAFLLPNIGGAITPLRPLIVSHDGQFTGFLTWFLASPVPPPRPSLVPLVDGLGFPSPSLTYQCVRWWEFDRAECPGCDSETLGYLAV